MMQFITDQFNENGSINVKHLTGQQVAWDSQYGRNACNKMILQQNKQKYEVNWKKKKLYFVNLFSIFN